MYLCREFQRRDMSKRNRQQPIVENVTITDYAAEGKSLVRIDDLVVFVPFAVPGDVVDLKILKKKHSYAEAVVVRMVQPSPVRAVPFCRHFGICGGCKWQNLPYEKQRQHLPNRNPKAVVQWEDIAREQYIKATQKDRPAYKEACPYE